MASCLPLYPPRSWSVKSIKTKSSIQSREAHQLSKTSSKPNGINRISNKSRLGQISSLSKQGLVQEAFCIFVQMDSDEIPIGPELYGELLQGCIYKRALREGQQIHARIIKNGSFFSENEYLVTKLLIFYAKCDFANKAEDLFLRQHQSNVFSWATMIGLHSRSGLNEKALMGFCDMMEAGAFPDNFVVPNALKACSALQLIGFGKAIHSYILKMGLGGCVYVLSSLVDFYGKCGILSDARKVFEVMPQRNVVTWNSLLVGFVQNRMNEEAMELFLDMRFDGVQPTQVSISSFLSSSANLVAIDEGRQVHALAVVCGIELNKILGSSLLNFYCKVGLVEDAESVFHRILSKDEVAWNLLISGYVNDGQIVKALYTCQKMREESFRFDSVTLSSIIAASIDSGWIELGKVGHGFCIRNNLVSDIAVASSIIDLYASCGRMEYAQLVFHVTASRDLVLWNTLISAYAQYGFSREALTFIYQMQLEGLSPNVASWNSVILGFLVSGQVNEALDMFAQMQLTGAEPTSMTWSTLICGLAQNGYGFQAIWLFEQILLDDIRPSAMSIVGVLQACTVVASMPHCRGIHGLILRRGLLSSLSVTISLIDMYSEYGSINIATSVFDMIVNKNLTLYNAMISGYALHGKATEALMLYANMKLLGMKPDIFTFSALLSACSHAGLVCEGLNIFTEMTTRYHMTPRKEHYYSLLTLLAPYSSFSKSCQLICSVPSDLGAHTVESLLALSKKYYEIELGECCLRQPLMMEPKNSVNYVRFAILCSASTKSKEAAKARALMKVNRVRKNRSCSWILVGFGPHAFGLDDRSHPQIAVILETLSYLDRETKLSGCASDIITSDEFGIWQETLFSQ